MNKYHNKFSLTFTVLAAVAFAIHGAIGILYGLESFYNGVGRIVFILFVVFMAVSMSLKSSYVPNHEKIAKNERRNLHIMSNLGLLFIFFGVAILYITIIFWAQGVGRYISGVTSTLFACLGLLLSTLADYRYSQRTRQP